MMRKSEFNFFLLVVTLAFRVPQVRKSRRIKAKKQAENSEEAEVVENGEEEHFQKQTDEMAILELCLA